MGVASAQTSHEQFSCGNGICPKTIVMLMALVIVAMIFGAYPMV